MVVGYWGDFFCGVEMLYLGCEVFVGDVEGVIVLWMVGVFDIGCGFDVIGVECCCVIVVWFLYDFVE